MYFLELIDFKTTNKGTLFNIHILKLRKPRRLIRKSKYEIRDFEIIHKRSFN